MEKPSKMAISKTKNYGPMAAKNQIIITNYQPSYFKCPYGLEPTTAGLTRSCTMIYKDCVATVLYFI